MEKLLISLIVPALEQRYDLFVPQDVPVRTLIEVMVNGVRDLSDEQYQSSGREMLMSARFDLPLQQDQTLSAYGIRDGETLILI